MSKTFNRILKPLNKFIPFGHAAKNRQHVKALAEANKKIDQLFKDAEKGKNNDNGIQ